MPNGPNPPAGRLAPGLHVGSINMRGMRATYTQQRERLQAAMQLWIRHRWQVVFVQETHLLHQREAA